MRPHPRGRRAALSVRPRRSSGSVASSSSSAGAWRLGLRTERLNPGTPDYGINASSFASSAYHPHKNTLMIDFNPSEFSRVRLQLAQDRAREGIGDNQLFLQYQMSLGAHGAHSF